MSVPLDEKSTFWQQNIAALLEYYQTPPAGLSSKEAANRLKRDGPNVFHPVNAKR